MTHQRRWHQKVDGPIFADIKILANDCFQINEINNNTIVVVTVSGTITLFNILNGNKVSIKINFFFNKTWFIIFNFFFLEIQTTIK